MTQPPSSPSFRAPKRLTILVFLGILTALFATTSGAQEVCPQPISDWLENAEDWPVAEVTLARKTYGPSDLDALLAEADGHDASLFLASELAATQLNLAAGVETENPIDESLDVASSLLDGLEEGLPGHVALNSEEGQQMAQAAGPLAALNNAVDMSECFETIEIQADAPGYRRGSMLVRYVPEVATQLREAWLTGADPVLPESLAIWHETYGVTSVEPLLDPQLTDESYLQEVRERYPERSQRAPSGADMESHLGDLFELQMEEQIDIQVFADVYTQAEEVVYAEPDRMAWVFFTPNDTYFNATQLWGLHQVGSQTAWDTATGSGVLVAVIDTGVDTGHLDLAANDSGLGWDFVDNDAIPQDGHGHGTHVAGTIAAVGDNALGVVGLAFEAEFMALRALGNGGFGFNSDLVDALFYAANNGADVINNSWGGFGISSTIESAVNYAHNLGALVVSAAGNAAQDACRFYPANVESSMAVSAFTPTDVKASYSNFGVKVDVAAPGGLGNPVANLNAAEDILSTSPPTSTLQNSGYPVLTDGGEKFMPLSGTSMAAPHVAALAALLIEAHPTWTVEELKQAIRQTADDVATAGFDLDSGHGRINASAALGLGSTALPSSSIVFPRNCQRVEGQMPVFGTSLAPPFPNGYFSLMLGEGQVPTSFTYGISSILNVNFGLLHQLDTEVVPDGWATIQLQTFDNPNSLQGEDRNVVEVDNVYISQPSDGDILSTNQIPVLGRASGFLGFSSYQLEYASGFNSTGPWTSFASSSTSVAPPTNLLANWTLNSLSDGAYTLRLRAFFSGHTSTDTVNVVIDRSMLNGWPVAVQHMPTFKSPQVADLDGDGQNEVIYGAAVFEANGTVKAGWTNQPGFGRTNSAVLDIDGDGDLEVLAIDNNPNCAGSRELSAYNPNHSTDWCHILPGGIASTVSAADVDGDGQDEVVVAVSSSGQTTVQVLDAATGGLESSFSVNGRSWSSVALADLDHDGSRDLILATDAGQTHATDANGNPLPGWPASNSGLLTQDPVVGDIDGDGRFEVVVGNEAWNHDGTVLSGWPSVFTAQSGGAIAPLKDGDCAQEVVKATGGHLVISVHDDDGALKFHRVRSYGENGFVLMVGESGAAGNPTVADIDGDGQVEILRPPPLGHADGSIPVPLYGSEALSATDPPGFPKFINTLNPVLGNADYIRATAAVADLNGDGLADLISAGGGKIHAWNLGVPHSPTDPWPMFQRDLQNTGTQPLHRTVQITGGNQHLVARTERGWVRTAGDNSYAQLGDGTSNDSSVPVGVLNLCTIQEVASSLNHSLALNENGQVFGWGKNTFGQLGNGFSGSNMSTPVYAWTLSDIVQVATGGEFSLALKDNGTVWAWGLNSTGILGNGSIGGQSAFPVQVPGLQNIVAVSGGDSFAMALRSDGTVWTWGSNYLGTLGNGSAVSHSAVPVQASISNIVAIDAGGMHAIALRSNGTVWSWGDNSLGQLGIGSFGGSSSLPVQTSGLGLVQSVTAGRWHSAVLRYGGDVLTWGLNSSGQLGHGTTTDSNLPAQVTGLPTVRELSSGYLDTMVIDQTGNVWVWGSNLNGQLGNGTTTHSLVPIQTQF